MTFDEATAFVRGHDLVSLVDDPCVIQDLPESDAMALMTGRGFPEEGEEAGKWRRALPTSTQLLGLSGSA